MAPSDPLYLHRGYSDTGIGEGPNAPIPRGEQFLDGSSRLYDSPAVLKAIRPWMSLSWNPRLHNTLEGGLESWSYVVWEGFVFVVRLASTEPFERRSAYFSHARAWPVSNLNGFDPGRYLAHTEAFDAPWRSADTRASTPLPAPTAYSHEKVLERSGLIRSIVMHWLDAVRSRSLLVVAAPEADFARGASLHTAVAYARGAVPLQDRHPYSVRVYLQDPTTLINSHGFSLVVMPEGNLDELRSDFRSDVVILNSAGERLRGPEPSAHAQAYAVVVEERAQRRQPAASVFDFGDRADAVIRGMGGWDAVQRLDPVSARTLFAATYRIAHALERQGDEERGKLLDWVLRKAEDNQSPPWEQLIDLTEWRRFPLDKVISLLLREDAAPGVRSLQKHLERAIQLNHLDDGQRNLGREIQDYDRVHQWWDETPEKRVRLLALMNHPCHAEINEQLRVFLGQTPYGELAQEGDIEGLVRTDIRTGRLPARANDIYDMIGDGRHDQLTSVLDEIVLGTLEGDLGDHWVGLYPANTPSADMIRLLLVLLQRYADRQALLDPDAEARWATLTDACCQRLRAHTKLPPTRLVDALQQTATVQHHSPLDHPDIHLQLADVLTRADPQARGLIKNPLLAQLNDTLCDTSAPYEVARKLLDAASSDLFICVTAADLVDDERDLLPAWTEQHRPLLLQTGWFLASCSIAQLVFLVTGQNHESSGQHWAKEIRRRLVAASAAELQDITDALIEGGAWYSWRRLQDGGNPRKWASHWFLSRQWRRLDLEPTVEEWNRVRQDLGPLDGDTARTLLIEPCQSPGMHARTFPGAIPAFVEDQLLGLASEATDYGAIVELATCWVRHQQWEPSKEAYQYAFRGLADRLSGSLTLLPAQKLLVLTEYGGDEVLTLDECTHLHTRAGHLDEQAFWAYQNTILTALESGVPEEIVDALQAAHEWEVWQRHATDFLEQLHETLLANHVRESSALHLLDSGLAKVTDLDRKLRVIRHKPLTPPQIKRARQLTDAWRGERLQHLANLMRPPSDAPLLDAMLGDEPEQSPAWQRLEKRLNLYVRGTPKGREPHPFTILAEQIREARPDTRKALYARGWQAFHSFTERYPSPHELWTTDRDGYLPILRVSLELAHPGERLRAVRRVIAHDMIGDRDERWWIALMRTAVRTAATNEKRDQIHRIHLVCRSTFFDTSRRPDQADFYAALRRYTLALGDG